MEVKSSWICQLIVLAVNLLTTCEGNAGSPLLDVDSLSDNFVLETKQIVLKDYPGAFNPSLVRWNDRLLLCFRPRDPLTGATNTMGFVWLDEQFNPASTPQILQNPDGTTFSPNFGQDPRLIVWKERLYIVYNCVIGPINIEKRRTFISHVKYELDNFSIGDTEPLLSFDDENPIKKEKNWSPFVCNDALYLIRKIHPLTILEPTFIDSSCQTIPSSTSFLEWSWGELRGGTPALQIDDEYLAFFHSSIPLKSVQSKGEKIAHYFMGAYTFNSAPPFAITRISAKPIVTLNFYNGPEYVTWKPLRVVFPGGFTFDTSTVTVVYGKQDHEMWVVVFDKKALFDSLIPVF